jgi:hypothetical protein
VGTSGVFYESHLLQWAEGTLNLADLMKEPQASFPTAQNNSNQPGTTTAQSTSQDGKLTLAVSTNALLAGGALSTSTANATLALPREATPLIQQQLQTMEQQRFVWHGEVWPGQTMDWEISRDRQDQQSENDSDQTWQSAVNFELPQLGNISAQLQLTGKHLRLIVNAPNAATASVLQSHAGELAGALDNTGTQLDSLLIKNRESS